MSPRDKMVGRIATSLYHLISASQPGVFEELDQTIKAYILEACQDQASVILHDLEKIGVWSQLNGTDAWIFSVRFEGEAIIHD
jgi:hypothetical protein